MSHSSSSSPHASSRDHAVAKPGVELILILGALTAFSPLTTDMYLPAFPAIATDLRVPSAAIQQTLALFFVGMAGGQLLYGPLSDRFGRIKPLLAGLLLYVVASIGCAIASTAASLTFWRLLQGLGGCSGIVMARAIVRDRFDATNAARVLSQLTLVMGIAPILAPFLGGQLLTLFGWRSIFWLLTAFGVACFFASAFRLKESWVGTRGAAHPITVVRTFGGVLSDWSFLIPALTVAFSQASMFTYIMASPNVFIQDYGVTPEHFGFFFGANALGLIGASQVNRALLKTHAPYSILHVSTLAAAAAGTLVAVMAWTGWGGLWGLAGSLFVLLTALGFVGANGTACALANQGKRAGSASALIGTMQFLFAALAGAAAAHMVLWSWVGTSLHAMGSVIALCALISCALHWTTVKSRTQVFKRWIGKITLFDNEFGS